MKAKTLLPGLVLALTFLTCSKNETVIEDGWGSVNIPSYASLENSFTYAINAQQLTLAQTIPLIFTKNRLTVSSAVLRVQGSAIFTLLDSLGRTVHADTFSLSGAYRVLAVCGIPASGSVTFRNFTGTISYTAVADSLVGGMLISQFPNSEGSQWVYMRYDSIAQRRDTVTVQALGLVTLPSGFVARIWQRRRSGGTTDTQYVAMRDDTLRIFADPADPGYGAKFAFPLTPGKTWAGDFASDTSRVVRIESVQVPAGTFPRGYLVEERWGLLNDNGLVTTWLVPDVGIVKLNRRATWSFSNESLELLSYTIR